MDENKRRRRPAQPRKGEGGQPRRERPARASRRTSPRKDADAQIVYTPPEPFNRSRFVLRMATVVAVVLALLFGMSIFFKVKNVTVSGNAKYSAWDIHQAAGELEGQNLMTISKARISGSIISQLPYVKSVRVGIKLPDTVNIEITELDVTYAIADTNSNWWLMNDQGRVVDQTNSITAKEYTQVLGITIEPPTVGSQAIAKEPEAPTTPPAQEEDPAAGGVTMPEVETTPPEETPAATVPIDTISGAERLQSALVVLQQLGRNGFATNVDSVDVTNIVGMELWYDGRFQVNLGDTSRMDYKIDALRAAVGEMSEYATGKLDVSFTTWPTQVGYTPTG